MQGAEETPTISCSPGIQSAVNQMCRWEWPELDTATWSRSKGPWGEGRERRVPSPRPEECHEERAGKDQGRPGGGSKERVLAQGHTAGGEGAKLCSHVWLHPKPMARPLGRGAYKTLGSLS